MRFFSFLFIALFSISIFAEDEGSITKTAESGNVRYEVQTTILSPMKTLGKNAFWGGATGLLLGFAGHMLFKPNDVNDMYKYPAVLGVYAGSAYGIYDVLTREDFYVKTNVKGRGDRESVEKAKERKVFATVRKRLDSPLKNAFYDALWGGVWGFLVAGSTLWLIEEDDSDTVDTALRLGLGGGILVGLGSSLLYNTIQRKRINDLGYAPVENNWYAFYNPNNTSFNLGFSLKF